MKDGILQQFGTPDDIYRRPANTFVAGFIGSPTMNMVPASATATGSSRKALNCRWMTPECAQSRALAASYSTV